MPSFRSRNCRPLLLLVKSPYLTGGGVRVLQAIVQCVPFTFWSISPTFRQNQSQVCMALVTCLVTSMQSRGSRMLRVKHHTLQLPANYHTTLVGKVQASFGPGRQKLLKINPLSTHFMRGLP